MKFNTEEVIDISRTLQEGMAVYPGDNGLSFEKVSRIKKGDSNNVTSLKMGIHTGTHLDAPRHFIEDGDSIDQIPLSRFITKCQVVSIEDKEAITEPELRQKNFKETSILFKTNNSHISLEEDFYENYTALTEAGADHLIKKGIKLVGIDYLSVEGYKNNKAVVHNKLLEENILILEGINLEKVEVGKYYLVALPLKFAGIEGSPTRAVLFPR